MFLHGMGAEEGHAMTMGRARIFMVQGAAMHHVARCSFDVMFLWLALKLGEYECRI